MSSTFSKLHFYYCNFYLWMSKRAHDVFALVFNFLGKDWVPKHITIGLFETSKTFKQTLKNNYKNFYNNMD